MSRNACSVGDVGGTTMKKTLTCLLAAATIAAALAATATDASAQWRGRGWGGGWQGGGWRGGGWGPGVAAGVVGGAVIAGAIIASRPPGYLPLVRESTCFCAWQRNQVRRFDVMKATLSARPWRLYSSA